MQIFSVPLSDLSASKRNVRKTGGKSIGELAASIHAHGLRQNLTVIRAGKKFEVVAGSRRLAALKHLVSQGRIAPDYQVPVAEVEPDQAVAVGLAENTLREAMHPADQFEAFQKLVDEGQAIEDIAAAFGVMPVFVKQRLKLAAVSPKLFKLYREGKITLAQLEALAVSDDHAAQEAVWKKAASDFAKDPGQLRSALTRNELSSNDPRVRLVGLDVYVAAGGGIKQDLFSDVVFLSNPALLDQLVTANLEIAAESVRAEGWAWVEVRDGFNRWNWHSEFADLIEPQSERDYTKAEVTELEALDERDDFKSILRIEQLEDAICVWPDDARARAGAIVSFNRGLDIVRGLIRRDDAGDATGADESADQHEDDGDDFDRTPSVQPPTKPAREPTDLPSKIINDLTHLQTDALRLDITGNPRLGMCILAASLAERFREEIPQLGVGITFRGGCGQTIDAWAVLHEHYQAELAFKGPVLDWLIGQPDEVLHGLLAFLTAVSLSVVRQSAGLHPPSHVLMGLLGTDMADHFEPDAEFLQSIPSAAIIQAVTEAKGAKAAKGLSGLKKAELAGKAADLLKDSRWVPAVLRGPKPKATPDRKQLAANDND